MRFDIVHVADPRFRGGTSSAVSLELKAAHRFGISSALLPFVCFQAFAHRRFHLEIAQTLARREVAWLTGEEPVECDLVLVHHPLLFRSMPATPLRVKAQRVVCALHHPPFDGLGSPEYDYATIQRNLERTFSAHVVFAPVGPKVRAQFSGLVGPKPSLLRRDLFNLVDLSAWPQREDRAATGHCIIGRHSRADMLKWPDSQEEISAAYPDRDDISVRVLGGLPETQTPFAGPNWRIFPFRDDGVSDFLRNLDFYVYFHGRRWVEAFGIGIAEALATGVVTILDPSFEDLFEEGAVYSRPSGTLELIDRFIASPQDYLRQSQAGRRLVERKFSIDHYPQRMRELYDDLGLAVPAAIAAKLNRSRKTPPPPSPGSATISLRSRVSSGARTVIFVATNGIGLGHVTRLMAIAERMSSDVRPVFITQSVGSSIIQARGHAVDYMPSARKLGVTGQSWNRAYAQELLIAIEAFDASAVVFDSSNPYSGLLDVLGARPDIAWIWVRRALWGNGQKLDPDYQKRFDMVIEPGELARDEDRGITSRLRDRIAEVDPILLLDPQSRLSREEAAVTMGIDPTRRTAVVQLGSERNFDFTAVRDSVVAALLSRGVQVVEAVNPLALPTEPLHQGTLRRTVYPLAECFEAIDLLVTNAGYNSFHESIVGCVPTIFIPNEAQEMDNQLLRAAYARSAGLGFCLRTTELTRVGKIVDEALSAGFRKDLRDRSARLKQKNGAADAASAIEELLFSVRADRALTDALPRA